MLYKAQSGNVPAPAIAKKEESILLSSFFPFLLLFLISAAKCAREHDLQKILPPPPLWKQKMEEVGVEWKAHQPLRICLCVCISLSLSSPQWDGFLMALYSTGILRESNF